MAIDIPAVPDQAISTDGDGPVVGRSPTEKRNDTARKQSSPVRIPMVKSGSSSVLEFLCRSGGRGGDADDDGEGEMIPPHVIVEKRFGGGGRRTAFSVCTGNGRTLKGRDLRRVRNSVLMQTGFLEGRLTT